MARAFPHALRELPAGQRILVTPRVGTESPWSSKATDIVHVCGLDAVTRVERGTVFFIESTAPLGRRICSSWRRICTIA